MTDYDSGELLEIRAHRFLWLQGYFVRRRINLFTERGQQITDIDVLGIKFDSDFKPFIAIVDTKGGVRVKPVDRLLWLRGLMDYFNAHKGISILKSVQPKILDLALNLKLEIFSETKLKEIEKISNIENEFKGSYNVELNNNIQKLIKETSLLYESKKATEFFKLGFWSSEPNLKLKRTIAIGKLISESKGLSQMPYFTLESTILFSLSLLILCHRLFGADINRQKDLLREEMIIGHLNPYEQKLLAEEIEKLVKLYVERITGKKVLEKLPPIDIQPPPYFDDLSELIERTLDKPLISTEIPRFLDYVFYEFIISKKDILKDELLKIFPNNLDLLLKLSKNVINFFFKWTNLNKEIVEPLLSL